MAGERGIIGDMPAPAHTIRYTYGEYVAFERSSNVKHEFLGGQIYAMAGGTPEHAALAAAVIGLLFPALRAGACRAHDADLRVRTPSGLTTYPDVTVVCGPRELDDEDRLAVTNPTLIVEVLSRSTEEYDRGEKSLHYKSVPSLRDYVLVSHREPGIEVWTRSDDNGEWRAVRAMAGGSASLRSIDARLDVNELYEAAGPSLRADDTR
jgi:Uma2 family endonuclease